MGSWRNILSFSPSTELESERRVKHLIESRIGELLRTHFKFTDEELPEVLPHFCFTVGPHFGTVHCRIFDRQVLILKIVVDVVDIDSSHFIQISYEVDFIVSPARALILGAIIRNQCHTVNGTLSVQP